MDSEIDVEEIEFDVQPYQFEPVPNLNLEESDESSESDDDKFETERSGENVDDRQDVHLWCHCGSCCQMPSPIERKCCHDFQLCHEKMDDANITCITEHGGFTVNCLNTHVLELAFYEYLDNYGPVGNEEPIHELYRYIAYRRYTKWIWHRPGKKVRKVIPACVVKKIREAFPSEQFTGFKYPRDY